MNTQKKIKKKLQKLENAKRNLALLETLGYTARQMKCPYQYKDRNLLFYPTTGTYFDEYTRLTGKIDTLPHRDSLTLAVRPVVGQYGKEYEKEVWLFSEFSLPNNMLPDDETVFNCLINFQ